MGRTETTTLWMIEDLEPWPDEPEVGQVCEPATQWITPDTMDLPGELVRTIAARVEELETDAGVERRAHLGTGARHPGHRGGCAAGAVRGRDPARRASPRRACFPSHEGRDGRRLTVSLSHCTLISGVTSNASSSGDARIASTHRLEPPT